MPGIDQKASVDGHELSILKKDLLEAFKSLGLREKKVNKKIMKNKMIMCKSLVAKKIIKKNDKLTYDNVCFKRPGSGIASKYLKKYIGKRVNKKIKYDQLILLKDLS